jgi:LysR family pca operon transcriptional activator
MTGFLPSIIDCLSRRYPQIVVHAVNVQPRATEYRQLRDREVDLMLGRNFEPVLHDEVHTEILFEDRYLVVAGAASRWARRRKITLAELVNEPWIDMPQTSIFDSFLTAAFFAHGLQVPRKSVLSFSHHLRNELLATGRFLTIVAGSVLEANAEQLGPQGSANRPDDSATLCRCFHFEATNRQPGGRAFHQARA